MVEIPGVVLMKKIGYLLLSLSAGCILLILLLTLFSVLPEPISLIKQFPVLLGAYGPLGLGVIWFGFVGIVFLAGQVIKDRLGNKEDNYYERNVDR